MAANQISILIQAKDNASPALAGVTKSLDSTSKSATRQGSVISKIRDNWAAFAGVAASAGYTLRSLVGGIDKSIDSSNKLEAALTGLSSVARAFNQDVDASKRAAQELASDGLMTVAESATGLKNLLAAGFNLDQAITLMQRFKDSAAFGRQSALGFGQAVASATEGIKNGNSILVDNAGVTKNLSMMLTDAGYSAQDLMRASSDAGVRMAIFKGIVKETNAQVGDASKLANSAAGEQAKWSAQIEIARQRLGSAFKPALSAVLQAATPLLQTISAWIQRNPELVTGLTIATATFLGLAAAIGVVGTALSVMAPLMAAVGGPWMLAIVGIGAAIAALAGGAGFLTTKLALQRNETDRLTNATQRLKDAQNSLRDSQLRLEGATLSVERAQLSYSEAVRQYGPKSLEAREAAHNLRRAQQELADATNNAKTKQQELNSAQAAYSSPNRVNVMVSAARTVAGELRAISGAASGAAVQVGRLYQKASSLPSAGGISVGSGSGVQTGGGGGVQNRASGGPVTAGRPYVVGDNPDGSWNRTTELFVPNTSGQIVNNKDLQSMMGSTTNIYITGNIVNETPEAANAFWNRVDQTQRLAKVGMA